jgi:hypothetical protein
VSAEESAVSATVSLPHQGVQLVEKHRAWCAVHTGDECQSEETTIPGSSLSVWLAATGTERPRLVIDQPGDYIELIVRD